MKTNTAERNVSIAAGESSTFSISNNAKIFRILIDGLYADKIKSITREIWSNALDAHVQAGCEDRPFDVSFPNPFDPTFRVRDYGVSLSHEDVMHMYTDLGHSTKEDTNDAIGKFGIGSKSPFAYTDNFTVTVYLDGIARFYSAMVGSDGVPAIHLMGEQDTAEENGVEVAFPVEREDSNAFQSAAKRISHGFDVKPNVTNMDGFKGWPELPVLLEGDGWKLLSGAIEGYSECAYARMGPVLYPINANALGDITADQRQVLNHTFVIDFEMGDLEITASREELSYGRNDPTSESIKSKVSEIAAGLVEQCLNDFAQCDTFFEACTKYRDQVASRQIPEVVRKVIKENAEWNGRELRNTVPFTTMSRGWSVTHMTGTQLGHKVYRFRPSGPVFEVPAYRKTIIMLEDVSAGKIIRSPARIRKYARQNRQDIDQVLWVKVEDTKHCTTELLKFFDVFDGVEIVDVASLDAPETTPGQRGRARQPVQARRMNGFEFDEKVDISDEQFDEGGFYIPLDRMRPVVPAECARPYRVYSLLYDLGAMPRQTIIGAPKSMWKKFEGDQWVNLYDFAEEWLRSQDFDFAALQARREAVGDVRDSPMLQFLAEFCDTSRLQSDSVVLTAVALRQRAKEDTTSSTSLIRGLADALGIPVDTHSAEADEMQEEHDMIHAELAEAYPLLSLIFGNYSARMDDNLVDKVTDYVIMSDTNAKTNHFQAAKAA